MLVTYTSSQVTIVHTVVLFHCGNSQLISDSSLKCMHNFAHIITTLCAGCAPVTNESGPISCVFSGPVGHKQVSSVNLVMCGIIAVCGSSLSPDELRSMLIKVQILSAVC